MKHYLTCTGTVPFLGKHQEPQAINWKAGEASVPFVRMGMAWPWQRANVPAACFRLAFAI